MENTSLLQHILSHVPYTLYTLDLETRQTTFLNKASFLGYSPDELQAPGSILHAVHPDDLEAVQTYWQEALQLTAEDSIEIVYRLSNKTGQWRWIHSRASVITCHDNGLASQLLVSLLDITEYKQIELALTESESRFRRLYERAPLGYQSLDADGRFLEVNLAMVEMLGFTREELIGQWFGDFLIPADAERFKGAFVQFLEVGEIYGNEFVMARKDGSRIIVSFDGRIGYDADGRFLQTHCIASNITDRRQTEAEHRLQTQALEATANSIVITDRDGKIEWLNPAFTQLTGYSTAECSGRTLRILKSGHHDQAFYQALWETILSGQVWQGRMVNRRKNGTLYHEEMTITPVKDTQGKISHFIAVKQDVTERMEAEDKLQKWGQIFEHADWGVVTGSADGQTIEMLNPAFAHMHGHTVEELAGTPIADLFAPEYRADIPHHVRLAHEKGHHSFESVHIRKDGSTFPVFINITAVKDPEGNVLYRLVNVQDITERVRAEKELLKWGQIFEHANWGVVVDSADGKTMEMMNPAFAQMHGRTVEELVGKPVVDVFAPAYRDDVAKHARITEELGQYTFESYHMRADGAVFPIEANATAVKDPEGNTLYRVVNVQDISNRVHAETEIRQQSHELALINKLNHAANQGDSLRTIIDLLLREIKTIFAADDSSVYLLSQDKAYLHLQNLSIAPTLVQKIEKLIGREIPAVKIRLEEGSHYYNVLQNGRPFATDDPTLIRQMMAEHTENRLLKKLVPRIAPLLSANAVMHIPLISDDEPIGLLDIARKTPFDKSNLSQLARVAEQLTAVIQRKQIQETLERVSNRNRLILQAAAEGIYGLDNNGNTIFVNAAAEKMLGWSAAELIGKPHHDIIHHSRADGSPYPAADCPVHATLENSLSYQGINEPFWRKDGSSFPVEYASSPIYEGDKQVGVVVTFVDISERLRQESYLQGQQRLATVGQLAAGIAHDFNNIMAVISLYTDLTQRTLDPLDVSQKRLQVIREQANRAADLIQQILDFSRQSDSKRRQTDLRPFLKELLKLLERTVPENILLKMNYDEGAYPVKADLTQLQQVLMNLVVNARDAMPDGGTLRLNLAHLHLKANDTPPLPDIPPGDWVKISVSDTGSGIAPDDLSHIFEPFFTTKEIGKGTGLGLAQVHGIIKQHNGYIGVASQIGVGTTFTIYLPVADADEEAAPDQPDAPLFQGNGETILVVEDEEAIRTAVCEILASLNYQPLDAANGREALQVYAQHAESIALVLSDMMMPGMSGMELNAQLRIGNPGLKFVLLSGYPLEEKVWRQEGISNWIKKPVNMEELGRALREALHS